jgi:hypothetical protein
LVPTAVVGQKQVKVRGEYVYRVPANVSREAAVKTAVEQARLQALGKEFGWNVSERSILETKEEGGKVNDRFVSHTTNEVKGEWLEDISKPDVKFDLDRNDGTLIVTAAVHGRARELTGAGIDFSAKILKNGFDARFESNDFRSGDEMYLLFSSPVDGYLTVYLGVNDRVYCLLPYRNSSEANVEIKHGQSYVFFSAKHADTDKVAITDNYALYTDKPSEDDMIYIIFSPNQFVKANDAQSGDSGMPRELSADEFQRWLTLNQNRDKDLKIDRKLILIKK